MCAGAAVHARMRRLVYGADDPKAGAVHSILQVVNHPSLNHQMEIRGGVLAGRCGGDGAGVFQEASVVVGRSSVVRLRFY